ncbi:DUF4252 domain-containing protein [Hymenobacter caeli]|uniref:DUF4252 domain-containing protein n=1 Tax=Hymenobacter caeli TaxID=2735894 RepID=A0ABX2FVB5_9BACT|nr:DUF4252 domain-containing protein [Hymenobacter caeli]NRT20372.1 hypothetical protein [Hymenobacter caeli]
MPKRPIFLLASFFIVCLLLLAGCRASGPGGGQTRTVAAFFKKYEGQPGFHTTAWSADLLQRLALVKAAKLLGGSDLSNAITSIRSARVISFAPTTAAARDLAQQGLRQEAAGVLQSEKYTALSLGAPAASSYQVSTRGSGDKVTEFAATGQLPDAADSFVLVAVDGNFSRSEVEVLSKYLPALVQATGKGD